MKLIKFLPIFILAILFASCGGDEPARDRDIAIYDRLPDVYVKLPAGGPATLLAPEGGSQYLIINSLRDIYDLPSGTISKIPARDYALVDYSKYSLILVKILVPYKIESDDEFPFINLKYDLRYDSALDAYVLGVTYRQNLFMDQITYDDYWIVQFGFTTDKLLGNTKIEIFESRER